MPLTKSSGTLIAAGTSNAAGATTRGTLDVRSAHGGFLTTKVINGATGPTVQAVVRILISHATGATPAAASSGADWKLVYEYGGGVTASTTTEFPFEFGPGVQHLEVEVTGNTGQAVTCEALATTFVDS